MALTADEKRLFYEIHKATTGLPERMTALEIAVKGNGTKGLGERMDDVEEKVGKNTVTLWKVIAVVATSSGGAATLTKFLGG